MQKGFTLVELSIVLVIIGLLIGGVLIGQSLIEATRVNAFVQQITQIQVAMEQFKSKYSHFPGDSPLFTPAGDGDGIVESTNMDNGSQTFTFTPYDYEVLYVWPHLWQSGFLRSDYPEFSSNPWAGTSVGQNHYPALSLGEADEPAGAAIYTTIAGGLSIRAVDYSPTGTRQIQSWTHANCAYTVGEAFAIDVKIDGEAISNSGNVTAREHCSISPGNTQSTATLGGCYSSSGEYLLDNDDDVKRCYLDIRLFEWGSDVGLIR